MNSNSPIETLTEIRSIMERSTRFISLNGLAGVFAGVFALAGAGAAYYYLKLSLFESSEYRYLESGVRDLGMSFYSFFVIDALLVLVLSIGAAVFLSVRKARKKGLKVWDNMAKRVLINMLVPLATGGVFCAILLFHGFVGLVAPVMLLFYGLALFNTSKFTYNDIRILGILEIMLGILSAIWIGYGLLFWAIGFGLLHIVYGIVLYLSTNDEQRYY
ncbi:MAG: hypothetical protein HC905_15705 [Bacteroidales bacterium]|nr:hypothetical protein [Bacteroidales bacterium]